MGLNGSSDAVPAVCALSSLLISLDDVSELISLVVHLVVRPQEAAPETQLFDPADFIDQFVLLARMFLFIPHHSTLCLPVHINSFAESPELGGLWNCLRPQSFNLLSFD